MSNVIKVTVMEGADLLAVDKGGTSDPFCVVTLLDFMDEPFGKPQKTKTIRKTLTPQWKQSFAFTLPPSAVGCKLRLEVFDHDKGFLKNAPVTALGATHLSLAMLQPGTSQDNWFALERWGEMSEVSGKVRVLWARPADGANKRDAGDGGAEVAERRDTLNVDASLASLAAFEVGMSEEEKAKKEAEAAKAGLPPGVDISVTDPYPKKPPNELTVVLMRASGLRVMDKSLFGRGSSDPYVVFECDGETAKSTVKRKCLDPVYIETFTFPAFDAHANLTLTVFDHDDLGKDDFMGKYEMRMDALRDKRLHREVVKLRDANGVLDGDRGEVEVFLAWRTNGKLIVELPTSVTSLITSADAYADCDVNELTVVVIRATRLLAMDSKLFGGAKSSDPYLALECDGMKIKTNHKPKTTKPVWLEVVRIPVDRYAHAWLECKVFDHDLVGNDDFRVESIADIINPDSFTLGLSATTARFQFLNACVIERSSANVFCPSTKLSTSAYVFRPSDTVSARRHTSVAPRRGLPTPGPPLDHLPGRGSGGASRRLTFASRRGLSSSALQAEGAMLPEKSSM